jgi:hypothetical protein
MTKRLLTLALAGLLLNLLTFAPVRAETKQEKDARRAEKVKQAVRKLGTGEKARIKLKLKDETKVRGYVSEIGEESFQVTDAKSGAATSVAYAQVKQVEGRNLSTGAKVAIGLGIVAGILAIVVLVGLHEFREDCCF